MTTLSASLVDGSKLDVTFRGYKPQKVDPRDAAYAFRAQPGLLGTALPPKHDNLALCSPVEQQGTLGSCTAQTVVGLVEANENRQRESAQPTPDPIAKSTPDIVISGVTLDAAGNVTFSVRVAEALPPQNAAPAPFVHGSRLFHYYATRRMMNTVNTDSGATMRDAIKAAATYGVVDEALWPYDIAKYRTNPAANVWTEAARRKVTSYHAIANGDLYSMKAALVDRWLVAFGFLVYPEMLSASVATTGLLPMPRANQRALGGHAVALVGYDDDKVIGTSRGAFLVRNSWGAGWGLGGYFWMPYDYVGNPKLAMDFWVVQSAPL